MRTLLVAVLLACLSGCARSYSDGRQATSFAGEPLMRIEPEASKRAQLESELSDAFAAWSSEGTEAAAIRLGKAWSSLGDYRSAIDVYTAGLARYPDSHRLRRHRGHRYITVHELDHAAKDFAEAWSLVKNKPDTLESADGSSTDKSAILYHYGLTEYLRGEYAHADEVFDLREQLTTLKDENVVSAASWHYWALRRTGRVTEAAKVIAPIREGMDVKENKSYYTMCRLYRGLIPLSEVERQVVGADGKINVGLAYAVACWRRFELKDEAGGRAVLERIVATGNWTAFGFIAAEGDLQQWPK